MKRVLLTLIASLACLITHAKETAKMETELEIKNLIDLGVILDTTQPVELFVPVRNKASRTITISKLSKDCSCTSVSIDKKVLKPGETATVRISTNLTGKTNQYVGNVVIQSDAVEQMDEIQVTGIITGQIRIRPAQNLIVLGDKYQPANFTVFCDDQTGPWKYEGFKSDDPNLQIDLAKKSSSPTTSTYEGLVSIRPDLRASYKAYGVTSVALKFSNEKLQKHLDINYTVELAIRRKLATDPAQVTFGNGAKDQKRTVLVQSGDPIEIDSATCSATCIKPTLQRIDAKTFLVELAYTPPKTPTDVPPGAACDLQFGGKTMASIPINVVTLH